MSERKEILLRAVNKTDLEIKIKEHLQQGWQCSGARFEIFGGNVYPREYCQVMIKDLKRRIIEDERT